MSNFMHKVKEAVTDHHDRDNEPTNEPPGTHNTYKSTNPYAKDPAASQNHPSMMAGPESGRTFDSRDTARGPDTYGSATTGANTTNAGPHNSKLGNKMDPRVDSDLDHRAQNQNPRTMGNQHVGAAPQAAHTGNMAPSGQPQAYGTDHHTANEDKYNKSTQERKAHNEPGNQMSSEDTYNSSTQEHKTHSTTSHTAPCEMNPAAGPNEPGLQGRTGQPEFGGGAQGRTGQAEFGGGAQGRTGQPEFGGGGAAGGSSYTQPPMREQAGMQNTNRMGKVDPQAQGMGNQQNDIANQRSAY